MHQIASFHGYWPIKAREVEPRIGGTTALAALVKEAHKHGIRVISEHLLNDVHQEHEYFLAHPEWFRDNCVCGDAGCDWEDHALDCKFASYLPDVNHTVPQASAQFTADAVWWLDTYDLDGLYVDALKHLEAAAVRNLAAEVRETFERGGTRYFLTGETLHGWFDCGSCNDDSYADLGKALGPLGIDGQADWILWFAVAQPSFAYGERGLIHADYWVQYALTKWPVGSVMMPSLGAVGMPRFTTLADYRGQDAAHSRDMASNAWSNAATAPSDDEPYRLTRIGLSWLLGLPGAPLMQAGDEYGQWGGGDPSTSPQWRPEAMLSAQETATLAIARKLGLARKGNLALRRGAYVPLYNLSDDTLVFGRKLAAGPAAVVGINRATTAQTVTVDVSALGFAAGTTLHDLLGAPDVKVSTGHIVITVPSSGAVLYAPPAL